MYFYINYYDAKLYVNTQYDYIIEFPRTFSLEGDWVCALVESSLKHDLESELYLYCDVVDNTMVHGKNLPLVRTFQKSEKYTNPFYIPVTTSRINRIRFTIKDRKNITPNVDLKDFSFVLHFMKI